MAMKPETKRLRGSQHPASRLTEADVIAMRLRYAQGHKLAEIARAYPQASKSAVFLAVRGVTWGHLPVVRKAASPLSRAED